MPTKRELYMRLMGLSRLAFCGDMQINYEFQDHRDQTGEQSKTYEVNICLSVERSKSKQSASITFNCRYNMFDRQIVLKAYLSKFMFKLVVKLYCLNNAKQLFPRIEKTSLFALLQSASLTFPSSTLCTLLLLLLL